MTILAIPLALAVRMLRPFRVIRFGHLINTRIGHFALDTEIYLCNRDADNKSKRFLDIFYYPLPSCNKQLEKMWNRILHNHGIARWIDRANRLIPGWKQHEVPIADSNMDFNCLIERTRPHLYFTDTEERFGREELRKMGIPDKGPFVCFLSRDESYLRMAHPATDWGYHNFRDTDIRNCVPAAEELVRQGYFAVRMGAFVKEALNVSNPKIIDYAIKWRTDFLDIYLGARCNFFIVSSSGLAGIPIIFRCPIALVNLIPSEFKQVPCRHKNSLFISKKMWLKSENRFLTYREIIDSEIGKFYRTEKYERSGIEVVENTAEEIKALAIEMDARLNNRWQSAEEDEELQRRFRALFKANDLNRIFLPPMGSEFLRENKNLLE